MFRTKVCTKCGVEKSEFDFSKGSGSDGLNDWCKDCVSEKDRKRREKRKAKYDGVDPYDGEDKTCIKCLNVFPKEERHWVKDPGKSGGLSSYCRVCCKRICSGYIDTGDLAIDITSRLVSKWRAERNHKRNKRENATPWFEHCGADFFNLLIQQHGRCAVSDVPLTPENVSVDHIVPVVKGGTHELSNLRLVEKNINFAMNSLDDASFIEMCRKVVQYQLDLLFWGNKKPRQHLADRGSECSSLGADPDLG